jgi:hypothetical protein
MDQNYIFLLLVCIGSLSGMYFTLKITSYLSKRDIKINYWLLRIYMIKYVRQYRKLTIEETGKPGSLFYAFVASWSFLLTVGVIWILLLTIGK